MAYEESIARAGQTAPSVKAQIYLAWSRVYRQRGDWVTSEKYCLRSIGESQSVGGQNLSIAEALDELGTIFLQRRNLVEAEAYFRRAGVDLVRVKPAVSSERLVGKQGEYPMKHNILLIIASV